MGDPVGPQDVRRELAWELRELADRHGASAVFYEVGAEDLPIYLDLGLRLRKLGEEARVPLAGFSLEGGAPQGAPRRAQPLRCATAAASRCVPRGRGRRGCLAELRADLGRVARAASTRARSASRSARSTHDYLARGPVAIVAHGGTIVAFANVWAPDCREELSIDLMRYADDAPSGVDGLPLPRAPAVGAAAQGYAWFSLGMAPLAGFEHHRLAPLWNRLGALLFRHGEQFYNFQGLRSFKDKFDPVWEPRYLASPGGLAVPFVLTASRRWSTAVLRGR